MQKEMIRRSLDENIVAPVLAPRSHFAGSVTGDDWCDRKGDYDNKTRKHYDRMIFHTRPFELGVHTHQPGSLIDTPVLRRPWVSVHTIRVMNQAMLKRHGKASN